MPPSEGNTSCGDKCQIAKPIEGFTNPRITLLGKFLTYNPRQRISSHVPYIISIGMPIIMTAIVKIIL